MNRRDLRSKTLVFILTFITTVITLLNLLFVNLPNAKAIETNQPLISKIEVNNGKMDPYNSNIHRYRVDLDLDEELPLISVVTVNPDVRYEIANLHQLVLNQQETVRIIAYDNLGNSDVYLLDIVSRSSNAKILIKYLTLTNGILSPKFDYTIHNYYAVVENNQNNLALQIQTPSASVKYELYNNDNLPVGKRTQVVLKATDEEGHQDFYYISTFRKSELASQIDNNLVLSSISLNNSTIPLDFSPWTFHYDVQVKESVNELKVSAVAQNAANNIRIYGNNHLQKDVPTTINILVTSNDDNDDSVSIYTLDVKKVSPFNIPIFTYAQLLLLGCFCIFIGVVLTLIIGKVNGRQKHKK